MDAQELATLWLCLPCSVTAQDNPHTMAGATLEGVMFARHSFDTCTLCGSTALGYRKQFTLWGN
jgi:hypothetical protein